MVRTRNIRLLIEYDGSTFAGWQSQPHKKTIQQAIEKVLGQITQEKIHLIGASRTDAGVHAMGQVANFQTRSPIACDKLRIALNGLLAPAISILHVQETTPTFHANKDARRKVYRYLIWNSPVRSAMLMNRAWHVYNPLNLKAMQKGTRDLVGRHDFSAFRGTRSDTKTSVRTLDRIKIDREGSLIKIEFSGDGFLKYMVRNIVGTLVDVGKGCLKPGDVGEILRSKDRKKARVTAPACGLYLMSVQY